MYGLNGVQEGLARLGRAGLEEGHPRGDELGGDGLYEEASASSLDRIRGEQARVGKEVGDELEEDERLGNFDGLGGGLVRRYFGSAVRNGGDLACRVHLWCVPCRLVLQVDHALGVVCVSLFEREFYLRLPGSVTVEL